MGAADIELLAVVHADDEFVATGGKSSKVENMRRAEGVLFSHLLPVDPHLALPNHPLEREGNAAAFPILRNFDGAAIPSGTHEGILPVQARKPLFADDRLHREGHAQSSLVSGPRKAHHLFEAHLRCDPILAEPNDLGIQPNLPLARERLGFLGHQKPRVHKK